MYCSRPAPKPGTGLNPSCLNCDYPLWYEQGEQDGETVWWHRDPERGS